MAVWVVALLLTMATWAEPVREEIELGDNDPGGVKSLLETLLPEIKLEIDGSRLILLSGSREMVDQGLELLRQLNLPLERVSLRAQLVGLSATEQDALGIQWQRAGVGNAVGITYMSHNIGRSTRPLSGIPDGPVPAQEVAAESGSDANFHWTEQLAHHSIQSGNLVETSSPIGLDLEVTTNVKSDGNVVCKFLLISHLPGRNVTEYSDLRIPSGESIAIGNLFPPESRLPALAYLRLLGPLFTAPAEPVLIFTPTIFESQQQ